MRYGVSGRAPSIITAGLAVLLAGLMQLLAAERGAATAHPGAGWERAVR